MNRINFNGNREFNYPKCPKCQHLSLHPVLEELFSNTLFQLRIASNERDLDGFREDLIHDTLLCGLLRIRTRSLDFLQDINCLCDLSSKEILQAFCRWCKSVLRRQQALYFRKLFSYRNLVERIGKELPQFEPAIEIYPSDEEPLHRRIKDEMQSQLDAREWAVIEQLPYFSIAEIAKHFARTESTIRRIRIKALRLFVEALKKYF
jgi:hypothetical protein